MDEVSMLAAKYGNAPVATGAGAKTFDHPIYAYMVVEDTVIASVENSDGAVTTGWEGVTISTAKGHRTVLFGRTDIVKITITSGGNGEVYYSNFD